MFFCRNAYLGFLHENVQEKWNHQILMINYHLIGKCYSELQRNVKDIKDYTYKVLMYYLAKCKYGDISLVNKLK